MTLWLFLSGLALAPTAVTDIIFKPDVVVTGTDVFLADVADISRLPEEVRSVLADVAIASLPETRNSALISHDKLLSKARARAPAVAAWLPKHSDGVLRLRRSVNSSGEPVILRSQTIGIEQGSDLQAAKPSGVEKGEMVQLIVAYGPFKVERPASALQTGREGERIFVMTQDRSVVSARCCAKP